MTRRIFFITALVGATLWLSSHSAHAESFFDSASTEQMPKSAFNAKSGKEKAPPRPKPAPGPRDGGDND